MAKDTITLWRPVGEAELRLIAQSDFARFPPRLPEQPIFYPVCNLEYAKQIAREWNARDGQAGYVTRFEVDASYLSRFPVQRVGNRTHEEHWIPAELLDEFQKHIVGKIEIVMSFHDETAV